MFAGETNLYMSDLLLIQDFLAPVSLSHITGDVELNEHQLGRRMQIYTNEIPQVDEADVILIGITEERGSGNGVSHSPAADLIRKHLYLLYFWHTEIKIADFGNIKTGAELKDTYAAARMVIAALLEKNKTVVIMGGSHDLTLSQYEAYKQLNRIVEATCIDGLINLNTNTALKSENFLMEMLTGEPNYIRHYNHLAFQSYFVHPEMLQIMDKLRFDCYRLGKVKEDIGQMEPVLRESDFVSIDIAAMAYSAAPCNTVSPNGLNGEEMCTLTQYAGISSSVSSMGIYGYQPEKDVHELTAIQIAQMVWYFIDGKYKAQMEAPLSQRDSFNEFHTLFNEVDTVFLQSKKTGRWWMQLPNKQFIACSKTDYQHASMNEIPERWLRAQERD
jgi:formiminoglutamase